jgi:endonuclease/exonuclease/phosphatase family metal-dependent hydrolase
VLTYNIAHGRGATDGNWEESGEAKQRRIQEIARLIDQTQADVVILNEVDFDCTWSGNQHQAEAIARLAKFPNWVEQRNLDFRFLYGSWKFGNAILSKYPVVDVQIVEYPAYQRGEKCLAGCKQGVLCTLQVSVQQRVRVLAVHLEHRSEDVRVASAQRIVDLAKSSPVPLVAGGDFNSAPVDFPKAEKTATGLNAMETLRGSGLFRSRPEGPPRASEMTFSSSQPAAVIDWILIPTDWEFADYRVIPSRLSDHRPVIATVELPDQ